MRRRLFPRREVATSAGLDVGALAPMVDMMTLMLVFLLRTWSTETAPAPPEGPFTLGETSAAGERKAAVELIVSTEAIYVEGHRVVATGFLGEEALIREVYDPLVAMRQKGRLEIHADAAVSYGVLRRVLTTARAAGFDELSLVGASKAGM